MNKAEVLAAVQAKISTEVATFEQQLARLQAGLAEETKSSAGDKYETGREMVAQEVNKVGQGLVLAKGHLTAVQRIDAETTMHKAGMGALVQLSNGLLVMLSTGYGAVMINDKQVQVISGDAPLAKLIWQQEAGFKFTLAGKQIEILAVS